MPLPSCCAAKQTLRALRLDSDCCMASKVAGWRQCRKHPRWLVVTTLIWVVGASVAAGAGAAEHATAIAAAAGQENGLLRQVSHCGHWRSC